MKYLVVFIAIGIILSSCAEIEAVKNPPNVIIIFTDDQGYADVGSFGAVGFETPHLDQMAREGITLTNFYVASPVCSPSRAALLTGTYPNRVGVNKVFFPNQTTGLNPEETTIADILKNRGYRTGMLGKWHLGDHIDFMPNNFGFDYFYGIPYSNDMWDQHPLNHIHNFGFLPLYENQSIIDTLTDQTLLTTNITEKAKAFIKSYKDNPFFLYIAHPQPHVPLFVSDKFAGKSDRGLYGDVIMELDWSVGEIIRTLKEQGIDENTLVIFTSDNGPWLTYGDHAGSAYPFREGKGTTWEGGVRVPFIAWFPSEIPAGKVIDSPVISIDILPTITSLVQGDLPKNKIDGLNIWGVLTGDTSHSPHKALYFYFNDNELQSVRYNNWKLHFPHTYGSVEAQEKGQGGLPGETNYTKLEVLSLYDLYNDPEQKINVAEQHPEIVKEICELADEKRIELGDRLTGIQGKEIRPLGHRQ